MDNPPTPLSLYPSVLQKMVQDSHDEICVVPLALEEFFFKVLLLLDVCFHSGVLIESDEVPQPPDFVTPSSVMNTLRVQSNKSNTLFIHLSLHCYNPVNLGK